MSDPWYLMSDSSYFDGSEGEEFSDYAQQGFDELLSVSPEAEDVLIEDIPKRVIIQNVTTDNVKLITVRHMLSNIGDVDVGNYVRFKNAIWLVIAKPDNNKFYEKSIIQKCNLDAKWIDENNNLIHKPSIVTAKTLYTTGIKDEKAIDIPNGMVGLQLPYDKDTQYLTREHCFYFNKTKYEITFYNEVEFPGLLVLICTETEPSYLDDKVNNIAGRWVKTDRGLIDRLPWLDSQMPQEPEPELKPSKGITYSYTAKMPYPNDPDDEIWVTDNATYIIHKFVDGVEVEGDFTFEIETLEGDKNIAKITDTTNNSVTVTGNNPTLDGLILLKAIDIDTGDIAIEKEIKIMGV